MRDIYLSLYAVPHEGRSGLLAFLVLAENEDEAGLISDEFVDNVNAVSAPDTDLTTAMLAQDAIAAMHKVVCFLTDPVETGMLSKAIARSNPHLCSALSLHIGGVFTARVSPEEGFPVETANVLRRRMVKHHALACLTVPLA